MENLQPVVAGEPIRADAWNKIVERVNAGTTATVRPKLPKTTPRRDLLVFNAGAHTIPPCGVAEIDGFRTTFSDEEDAMNKALNGCVVLNCREPRSSEADFVVATESIAPGKVGEAKFCGGVCFYALRIGSVEDTRRARIATPSAASSARYFYHYFGVSSGVDYIGEYRIIAESESGKIGLLAVDDASVRVICAGSNVDVDAREIALSGDFNVYFSKTPKRATIGFRGVKLGRYESSSGDSVSSNEVDFYANRLIAGKGIEPFSSGGAIEWKGFQANDRSGIGKISFSEDFIVQAQARGSDEFPGVLVSHSTAGLMEIEVVTGIDFWSHATTTKKIRVKVVK